MTQLVEVAVQGWGVASRTTGPTRAFKPNAGAELELTQLNGDAVTFYEENDSGGTTLTPPIVADADGTWPGWIKPGPYLLTEPEDGTVRQVEAVAGNPSVIKGGPLGVFADFAQGVPGSTVSVIEDQGSPTQFDAVAVTGVATITYDDTSFDPLEKVVSIASAGAGTANLRFDQKVDYPHFGRCYVRLSASPAVNIRFIQWQFAGVGRGRVRIDTNRKVSITDNASVAMAGPSNTVLALNTFYRFEWDITRHATNGVIVLRIYEEHETTPLETLTSIGFDTGEKLDHVLVGSIASVNLGACVINIGAYADLCTEQPGVYTAEPDNAWTTQIGDDERFGGYTHDGGFVIYARETFQTDAGHTKIRKGQPILRVDKRGNILLGASKRAKKAQPGSRGSIMEGWSTETGRLHAWSGNLESVNEPPDWTLVRACAINNQREGTDGEVDGSTFTSATADFTQLDLDHEIIVDGTAYWILEIVDPTTAILDDVNDDLADLTPDTGVTWSMATHPYPAILGGLGDGTAAGQIRVLPFAHPFIRSGTDGQTFGTTQFDSAAANFTDADVGRWIMIEGDPERVYEITAVVDENTVTLGDADAVTASGQDWAISGTHTDEGAQAQWNTATWGFITTKAPRNWNAAGSVSTGEADAVLTLGRRSDTYSGGEAAPTVLTVRGEDGTVEAETGDFEVINSARGVVLTSPDGSRWRITVDNTGALDTTEL